MAAHTRLLIRGGTVVPMTAPGVSLDADVLVEGGWIAAVGPDLAAGGAQVVDARDALVLPGFVQAHVHVVQSLARHRAEGRPLLRWLTERIWPYEAALAPEEVTAAARLGIAELLAGGTTAALDMGTTHGQDVVFGAAEELGIRLTSGKCHMDAGEGVPGRLLEDRDASLAEAEALGSRWHGGAGGRLRYAVAPRFVLSCSGELLAGAAELARRGGYLLHTHASENADETRLVRERAGVGNVAALSRAGLGGDDVVLAHCVHLDDAEVELLAGERTGVAHCPGANLKLGSGIADLPRLLAAGVRVGLGADGPPCNNRLSVFHEMALAGTLHNLAHGAGAVDPWTVLEMATWRGADVLRLDRVGRIAPGWKADIAVLDLAPWAMEPLADPAAVVVYGGGDQSVRHVIVDGRVVVSDGELATADGSAVRREARAAARAVARRLGWE
ncbi:MAG TPA: amidohydrolase family protein [Thermoanaerobaculaceae bacterium]|nr:amidohydrolase family protein [Thermoanaerobaculaceae bacterium]